MVDKRKLLEATKTKLGTQTDQSSAVTDALYGPDGRQMVLPLDRVFPRNNPRTQFDDGQLKELASTIKTNGVILPIIVRQENDSFFIIAGERRWRAAKLAGLKEIPAVIRQKGDALELALIENVQRTDLSPRDLCRGVTSLKEKHHYTDEQIGDILGKSRSRITEILTLNRLPKELFSEMSDIRHSFDVLLQVAKEPTKEAMFSLWNEIQKSGSKTVRDVRSLKPANQKKKKDTGYRFQQGGNGYRLTIQFKKSNAGKKEIKEALQDVLKSLS